VQPIVLPKTPVVVPTGPVFTKTAVANNLVANFTKIVDITARTASVSVPHDAGTALTLTDGVTASLVDQLNLTLNANGVSVTAVKGWTGRISFPVVATQSGTPVELFIGVEEDPAPVAKPGFSLVNLKSAQVSWTANASQVEQYNVYLGSQLLCTTTKTSCVVPVASIHNFATNATIESVGHDTTYSTKVVPVYASKTLVQAGLVHFTLGSSSLTPAAKKSLDSLINVMKKLGVTNVNLNGHTDSQGAEKANKVLSIARANAVKAYLAKALPKLKFNGKGFSSKVPAASNKTSQGQADNRRVEVLVG
jgi:outer membrane protein OmpA-like peptidoglycan-associated protein